VVESPERPAHFTLAYFEHGEIAAFPLRGSPLFLLVKQEIDVDGDECHTTSYGYRLATGNAKQDWLIRWEYFRRLPKPDYRYPLAHVHVNAELASRPGVTLPALHIPTSRVPLELVIWHVIAEWDVAPRSEDWQGILEESMDSFESKRSVP